MFAVARAMLRKDCSLLLGRGGNILHAVLLGLIVIVVFSLAQETGTPFSPREAATIFWLSSLFCVVLLATELFSLEESQKTREALVLLPVPVQAVYLGKALAAFLLLLLAQCVLVPATLIFLGQSFPGDMADGLLGLLLVDTGIAAVGSLLGALSRGQAARESLLSILLFPLLMPLLLSGISVHATCFGQAGVDTSQWFSIAIAFDAVFLGAGFFLFPFLFTGED